MPKSPSPTNPGPKSIRKWTRDLKNARIVGWYHSHPDFGIFLSERDCFIHEHFFSAPGQVAYVVDPVRGLEGMFAWHEGKPAPLPHFWVGNRIRTVEASQRNDAKDMAKGSVGAATAHQTASQPPPPNQPYGFATIVLGMILLFLLGYTYGNWRTQWEQRMVVEGAVAHFADTKVIRDGLETDLAAVLARLAAITQQLEKLPDPGAELSKDQIQQAADHRKILHDNLVISAAALEQIGSLYGLSDTERAVLAQIAAQKQASLRRLVEGPAQNASDQAPSASQSNSAAPPAGNAADSNQSVPTPAQPGGSKNDSTTHSTKIGTSMSSPIRINTGDLHTSDVDSYVEMQNYLRRDVGPVSDQPWLVRVVYANWFLSCDLFHDRSPRCLGNFGALDR